MKRRLNEGHVKQIFAVLLERFGEPIGKATDTGPGVPDERGGHAHKGEDPGNYGWGGPTCNQCGSMMGLEEDVCSECGMMGEGIQGGRHPGHAASCTCPDCSRPDLTGDGANAEVDEMKLGISGKRAKDLDETEGTDAVDPPACRDCGRGMVKAQDDTWHCKGCKGATSYEHVLEDDDLDQKAPPGGEKVVKALKKQKDVKNPWAVAWSMKDKGQLEGTLRETRMQASPQEVLATWEDLQINSRRNKRKGDIPDITPGVVSLEELASWLSTSEEAVQQALPKVGLVVDRRGNVVARGMTPTPFKR